MLNFSDALAASHDFADNGTAEHYMHKTYNAFLLQTDQGLALSLEIGEFSGAGTWKHNNLHARMRGA